MEPFTKRAAATWRECLFFQKLLGFALREWANANIPKRDGIMITLKPQWARSVRSIAGGAGARRSNISNIEHLRSVMDHHQTLADEGNVEGLPLTRRL